MELGGNAPFLVFEDADVDKAVEGAMLAKMRNIGEACTAANRFLVHESVAEEFSAKFAAKMAGMTVGRGTEDGVTVGPLVDATALASVAALVDDAKAKGATVVCGGTTVGDQGYFYAPTLLTGVTADALMMREEIFGPVVCAIPFGSEDDDVIHSGNDTNYGLASGIWTRDINKAYRTAHRLRAGTVWINCYSVFDAAMPFGGYKESGWGREMGHNALENYLETKSVVTQLA
jgi:succinate-semialdehyde dehydrogenase/glutarate-semialdehyde dehydrogenase